jgi:hypothetical protein
MSIQNLILGSLVSKGADRLLNPNRKNVVDINKFTGGGYFGTGDEEKDKGPTTFGGIAKSGIMSLIAQAILGPVFGPLALTLGRNIVDRRKQGLGFLERGDPTTQPEDVRGTFTATAPQFADVQDTLGSIDSGTDINYDTGDITDKSTGEVTGNVYDEVAISTPSPAPAYDFDDSGSDSGGGGGSSSASTAGDAADYSGPSPFRYGGLASLYR